MPSGIVFTLHLLELNLTLICRDLRQGEMGKSIRSKRLKRLRTLKRELVTPHYDEKEAAKNSVMEAALAAPKVEIPKERLREEAMGESPYFWFFASLLVEMCVLLNRLCAELGEFRV